MRAFADALDCVPMALAENSGLSPIETLANIKSRQAKEKNTRLGVDCMQTGSNGTFYFISRGSIFGCDRWLMPLRSFTTPDPTPVRHLYGHSTFHHAPTTAQPVVSWCDRLASISRILHHSGTPYTVFPLSVSLVPARSRVQTART
jgi:hypothetical protein